MPEIQPFRAYRYNSAKVGAYDDVLSPPYDVISKEEQQALYNKSPYNFVRLDLKKKDEAGDVYEATAKELSQWVDQKVFLAEEKPSIYVYEQHYKNLEGKKVKRIGFIALMKLDPKYVRKHEKTLDGPKQDRTRLLDTLKANMSPIFGLFEDPKRVVHSRLVKSAAQKPIIDVTIASVRHRLFRESDPAVIKAIQKALAKRPMYIADGHHRFEVSYEYSKKGSLNGLTQPASYVMTYLCATEPNDLTIYPTHRVLTLPEKWGSRFVGILEKSFEMKKVKSMKALQLAMAKKNAKGPVLGCIYKCRSGKTSGPEISYLAVTPKKKTTDLDVFVAQNGLILPLLEGEEIAKSQRIRYTRDAQEAQKWVNAGEASLAILLSKIPIKQIVRISDQNKVMPQKSTYFYSKLLSGLVFYKFDSAK